MTTNFSDGSRNQRRYLKSRKSHKNRDDSRLFEDDEAVEILAMSPDQDAQVVDGESQTTSPTTTPEHRRYTKSPPRVEAPGYDEIPYFITMVLQGDEKESTPTTDIGTTVIRHRTISHTSPLDTVMTESRLSKRTLEEALGRTSPKKSQQQQQLSQKS